MHAICQLIVVSSILLPCCCSSIQQNTSFERNFLGPTLGLPVLGHQQFVLLARAQRLVGQAKPLGPEVVVEHVVEAAADALVQLGAADGALEAGTVH